MRLDGALKAKTVARLQEMEFAATIDVGVSAEVMDQLAMEGGGGMAEGVSGEKMVEEGLVAAAHF